MPDARLAELLAGLGVATDVAAGLDMETSARATVLAVDLARDLGMRGEPLRTVYYTSMLRFVGCTSLAAETAELAGGDDLLIAPAVRIVHVALRAEIHRRIEGAPAALTVIAARRGTELDGAIVDRFLDGGAARLAKVEGSVWDDVLAAEPEPHLRIGGDRVARVAEAFARFTDLKSPFTLGHSEAVAARAVSAAEVVGMPAVEREQLRIAALLHDLGRVAIRNGIWDKPSAHIAHIYEKTGVSTRASAALFAVQHRLIVT